MSRKPLQEAEDIRGRHVLTAYAPVTAPGWLVFVELPREEAYAPLIELIERSGLLLLLGLALAVLAGIFLARRMVVPIQALQAGAARIGSGDLGQRISIKTGDELESLADQFNDMAGKLEEFYADLEKKVEDRTTALAQSVEELRALGEVSQAVNSTLDRETVLHTIVAKATQLSGTEAGAIYELSEASGEFQLRATYGMDDGLIAAIKDHHADISSSSHGLRRAGAGADSRSARRAVLPGQRDHPGRRIPGAPAGPAARGRPNRRRAGGAPPRAGRISQGHGRAAADIRRAISARCGRRLAQAILAKTSVDTTLFGVLQGTPAGGSAVQGSGRHCGRAATGLGAVGIAAA